MHTPEALGRSAAERRQKCLELLTCSVCELQAGPDHLAWKHAAAILRPFKQASVSIYVLLGRDGQLSSRLGFADGCPAKLCKSELCSCTKLADAVVCGVSANTPVYLVRLAGAYLRRCCTKSQAHHNVWVLQQSEPDTTSSMADRADRDSLQCTHRPAVSHHCKLLPKSSKSAATSSLYTKRAGPQPTFRGRQRNPTCIKQWAALTTWLRMNLHQVGHSALAG